MINNVEIKKIVSHRDHRGLFREIFRDNEDIFTHYNDKFGQFSHSFSHTDVIKGWHGHKVQVQWNYIPIGAAKVVLYDDRNDSSTYKNFMEFICGEIYSPLAYSFPPGVLHGIHVLQGPMHIFYITSGCYDLENDEVRIAYDDPDIGYNWHKKIIT